MFCPSCGQELSKPENFCPNCGHTLDWTSQEAGGYGTDTQPAAAVLYAGFWRRFAAICIDQIFVTFVSGGAGGALGLIIGSAGSLLGWSRGGIKQGASVVGVVVGVVIPWLYWALMESSGNQATLGKMALGIKVTDLEGEPISFGKATGRYFGKIISALILGIGFLMAGWTKQKQALHDMMADTLVVKK